MSEQVADFRQPSTLRVADIPTWAWLGVWVYALVLVNGNLLLHDTDTYWHIAVGRWILEHHALPRTDLYSFTKAGEPWVSSSWLAQVLYAQAYDLAGWAGPVILAAVAIAVTFALLAFLLGHRIPSTSAVLIAFAALVLSANHMFARPHVLALPVMLAWAGGLLTASERREPPSFLLLPLMALWANLHGGFLFGLVLAGGCALDAAWNAEAPHRLRLALRWLVFGIGALAACCATPYGYETILASLKILDLGELLSLIYEWMPANFASLTPFEAAILVLLAAALLCGVKLPPPRVILVLGLLHMALSHVRNLEIFALLIPLVALAPVASQFGIRPTPNSRNPLPLASAAALAIVIAVSTWAWAARADFAPRSAHSPAAAVDVLMSKHPKRVLNDLPFAGYLISRGVPVFLDGRAELYGEQFEMNYYRALELKDVNALLDLLKRYDIDAVLLTPATPAAKLLDHLGGWQRAYADENAVLHMRTAD